MIVLETETSSSVSSCCFWNKEKRARVRESEGMDGLVNNSTMFQSRLHDLGTLMSLFIQR